MRCRAWNASLRNPRFRMAIISSAAFLVVPHTGWGSNADIIGLTLLHGIQPSLTGADVRVGQVEANDSSTGGYAFEVNPSAVGQPASLFTYSDQYGNTSNAFNSSAESLHADTVASYLYNASGGVAPGISHVDNYSVDYFFNTTVFIDEPIPDAIVNQSFAFGQSGVLAVTIANQQSSDTTYDNYIAEYGTIFVSGVGNGGSYPYPCAPSTSYNGIAVAADDGVSAVGRTPDDGRSKPDITAPGGYTSFSTALVSGSAALLYQAGSRGDGGVTSQLRKYAVDPRTIKALLLNGADKQSVTFSRTHTQPLDPMNGAGALNVYNSYEQLAAGFQPATSIANTSILGGSHPADTTSSAIGTQSGWSFGSLTSTTLADAYANYIFSPPTGVSGYTLAATLVWERQYNLLPAIPLGINNLSLYLYDTTANKLVDYSNSTVDNVQGVYDRNLTPGDRYDLEVLKVGGVPGVRPGVVSSSEAYALAFNFSQTQATQGSWSSSAGGSASLASNWVGVIPQYASDTANFTSAITAPATVSLGTNWIVGNINFNNAHSYTIAPATTGPLTLDNGGPAATATINDSGGSHSIAGSLQLNSKLAVSVANAADTLQISGSIFDNPTAGGGGLTLSGNGTLVLSNTNSYTSTTIQSGTLMVAGARALPAGAAVVNAASLVIAAGTSSLPAITGNLSGAGSLTIGSGLTSGYLQIQSGSGTSSQAALMINSASTLDITSNTFTINYGAAPDPLAAIRGNLHSAYNGGNWQGTGLTSSTVRAQVAAAYGNSNGTYGLGYADGNDDGHTVAAQGRLLVEPALVGDANLDGKVDFDDLLILAQNVGTTNADWMHGDFNYDSKIDFNDLLSLAQNVGRTNGNTPLGAELPASFMAEWNLALAEINSAGSVPEPATLSLLSTVAMTLLVRRRRAKW